ncbi:ATP-binding protein [Nocardia sp. CA-135953]|uniref:ATP-binding protein n=1 Tax=Nocardia sp. CA-135953 TaxID=3239978 RepID=UPI003D97F4F5
MVAVRGGVVGNLPAELTSFVGRRAELLNLKRALSTKRLVTLRGAGGVGKTRLALRTAALSHRAFRDGVWFVDISPLRDPELLAPTVATALELQEVRSGWDPALLADRLGDREMLLVLDNCESLSHACAILVDVLLKSCPRVRVIATSRQPLDVAGEQLFELRPLPMPASENAVTSLPDLRRSDAITLFVDRARTVDPDFELSDGNAQAVVDLCCRLDGLPLAIELAAARVRHMSVRQIGERLDEHYQLLYSDSRSLAPRQRSLWSLIGWSYELCTEQEQALWARLTVFSGSFIAEAAESVCAGDPLAQEVILDTLAALVDKSIVTTQKSRGGFRYRMLDTIRTFGHERLVGTGAEDLLRRRHRDYYGGVIAEYYRTWFGPGQVETIRWLTAERDNLRKAIEFALCEPGGVDLGALLGAAVGGVSMRSGLAGEGRLWVERALASLETPRTEVAILLWVGGWCALQEGELDTAQRMLDDARSAAMQAGDRRSASIAASLTGSVLLQRGDLPGAMVALTSAAELADDDPMGRVIVDTRLGVAYYRRGDIKRGIALCEQAVAVCEAHGDLRHRSEALWELATMFWEQGEIDRADTAVREALRIHRSFDNLVGGAQCFETLAWIAGRRHDYERAAQLLGAADSIWQASDSQQIPQLAGHRERLAQECRMELGERKYREAHCRGARKSITENIGLALDETAARVPDADLTPELALLTQRERDVAGLLAAGQSNKEIAATLLISRRTVEAHVEHIFSKLGFSSRAQVAAWIAKLRTGTSSGVIGVPGSGSVDSAASDR